MTGRLPFTKRFRHQVTQSGLGYRPRNAWGDGELPAPWAEGDVVRWPADVDLPGDFLDRMDNRSPGLYVVCYATSIDEGDAWYFRVTTADDEVSGRLHVGYPSRSNYPDLNFMAPFLLVDTADPEGLRTPAETWALWVARRSVPEDAES